MIAATAEIAAVSVFKMVLPRVTLTPPVEIILSTSSAVKPPSGPIKTIMSRSQLQFLTEFTDKTKYTLEFDMKNTEGYDNFVTLNGYTIWNQQYSWIIVGGTRYSATPRYMSYVHVIVTRDGDTFTTNINNGQYIVTGTFENVTNILNVSKYGYSSSSSIYVKDLKITC